MFSLDSEPSSCVSKDDTVPFSSMQKRRFVVESRVSQEAASPQPGVIALIFRLEPMSSREVMCSCQLATYKIVACVGPGRASAITNAASGNQSPSMMVNDIELTGDVGIRKIKWKQ